MLRIHVKSCFKHLIFKHFLGRAFYDSPFLTWNPYPPDPWSLSNLLELWSPINVIEIVLKIIIIYWNILISSTYWRYCSEGKKEEPCYYIRLYLTFTLKQQNKKNSLIKKNIQWETLSDIFYQSLSWHAMFHVHEFFIKSFATSWKKSLNSFIQKNLT